MFRLLILWGFFQFLLPGECACPDVQNEIAFLKQLNTIKQPYSVPLEQIQENKESWQLVSKSLLEYEAKFTKTHDVGATKPKIGIVEKSKIQIGIFQKPVAFTEYKGKKLFKTELAPYTEETASIISQQLNLKLTAPTITVKDTNGMYFVRSFLVENSFEKYSLEHILRSLHYNPSSKVPKKIEAAFEKERQGLYQKGDLGARKRLLEFVVEKGDNGLGNTLVSFEKETDKAKNFICIDFECAFPNSTLFRRNKTDFDTLLKRARKGEKEALKFENLFYSRFNSTQDPKRDESLLRFFKRLTEKDFFPQTDPPKSMLEELITALNDPEKFAQIFREKMANPIIDYFKELHKKDFVENKDTFNMYRDGNYTSTTHLEILQEQLQRTQNRLEYYLRVIAANR